GGHVIDKDELIRKVWPDTFVEEVNLAKNVYFLRKILHGEQSTQYIETIPRRGYRFVARVREFWGEQARPFVLEGTTSPPDENRIEDTVEGKSDSLPENALDRKPGVDSTERQRIGGRLILPLSFLGLGLLISFIFWAIWSRPVTKAPPPLLKIVPITSF